MVTALIMIGFFAFVYPLICVIAERVLGRALQKFEDDTSREKNKDE